MKRLFLFFPIFIISILIWYGEARKFFCLDDGKCVTVWKTYNNICYVIPGEYYGLFKPSENFIQTTNTNNLTIFFTNELPDAFIYQSDQDVIINDMKKDDFVFYDLNSNSQKFIKILYPSNAKKSSDLKDNARLIDIFIQENYAIDKDGKKLR